MARASDIKGKISQRERVSLIADLLLGGAIRLMESNKEKNEEKQSMLVNLRSDTPPCPEKLDRQIQIDPR